MFEAHFGKKIGPSLLGTLETSLRGLSTRNDLKMVRSKGKEDSAVIVTNLKETET